MRQRGRRSGGRAMLLPAGGLYVAFFIVPVIQSFYIVLFEWSGLGPLGQFVGLGNLERLLEDTAFHRAVLHNFLILGVLMAVTNSISLLLAYLLKERMPLGHTYRSIIVLPYILSPLVTGFIWILLLNPGFGLVNQFLASIGLEAWQRAWLGDPSVALWAVALAIAWQWNGIAMLVFLARLQEIPPELVDAAKVDGAGTRQVFRNVVIPQLAPAFTIVNVLAAIYALRVFDLAYIIGGPLGAPGGSTQVMGTSIYGTAFGLTAFSSNTDMGYAMAQGIAQFAIVGIISLILLVYLARRERYVT